MRCLARCRSSRASSSARERSRAASVRPSGTRTSTTLRRARSLASHSASRRSFLRPRSAAGRCILETAPTAQSTPRGAQGAAQVEAGRAALVHRLGRLEPQDPLGDRRRVVAEPGPDHLAGHGVEGACGDAPRVDVETDCRDVIGHGGPLSVACGARPRLALRAIVARPTIELQGEGLPMFNSYRLTAGALRAGVNGRWECEQSGAFTVRCAPAARL